MPIPGLRSRQRLRDRAIAAGEAHRDRGYKVYGLVAGLIEWPATTRRGLLRHLRNRKSRQRGSRDQPREASTSRDRLQPGERLYRTARNGRVPAQADHGRGRADQELTERARETNRHDYCFCFLLELVRKMTPFPTRSTPSRSSRSVPTVSTNPGRLIRRIRFCVHTLTVCARVSDRCIIEGGL
jgi:hypothetical protein